MPLRVVGRNFVGDRRRPNWRAGLAAAAIVFAFAVLAATRSAFLAAPDSVPADRTLPEGGRGAWLDSFDCAVPAPAQRSEFAVLDFRGAIGSGFDSDAVHSLLNAITANPRIGGIGLRIDSTGGDSYVAKKIYRTLLAARQACGLPMAAFIGNVGTSGGYWMALAAGEIHADTLSTVGSVGVVAVYSNESEKLEKEGIRHAVIRTGDGKWPLMPYVPVRDNDVKKIRDSLDIVLEEFVAAVETARQGKLKLTREALTTGEAWMGRDALRLGLVDGSESVSAVATRLLAQRPTAYRVYDLARAVEGAGESDGATRSAGP